MVHYSTTVESPLSAEDAFAKLATVERFAEWDPGVKKAFQSVGEGPGLGSEFILTVSDFVGRDLDLTYKVLEFEEPSLLFIQAENGTVRSDDRITVANKADGCSVTYAADLTIVGKAALVGKVLDPVLGLIFNRIGDRAAAGLRDFLASLN